MERLTEKQVDKLIKIYNGIVEGEVNAIGYGNDGTQMIGTFQEFDFGNDLRDYLLNTDIDTLRETRLELSMPNEDYIPDQYHECEVKDYVELLEDTERYVIKFLNRVIAEKEIEI